MRVQNYDQLAEMPIGSEVYIVENGDVRKYTIVGPYPSEHIKSTCITYGTVQNATRWLNQHTMGKVYLTYDAAVDALIAELESDLEAVKRIYKSR